MWSAVITNVGYPSTTMRCRWMPGARSRNPSLTFGDKTLLPKVAFEVVEIVMKSSLGAW